MKIFVTGDNHIGKKYANHEKREALAAGRINALFGMVEKANAEECGLFAITGDLFENVSGISRKDIEAVVEALSGFNGTVVVLPGNHDYYNPDVKVWKEFIDLSADKGKIAVLNRYEPYSFDIGNDAVTIYPAFCDKPHSEKGENKLGWIKSAEFPDNGNICIGMAHGTVEGEAPDDEGEYFVMTRDELNNIPVDLWLIGHTHRPFPKDMTEEFAKTSERIFNAGTHVQTDVSNDTEGACFIIETDGKNVRAKKYVSGNVRFYRIPVPLTAGNAEREISDAVKELGDNSVVELILSGAVSEEEYADRHGMTERALERFLEHNYNDSGLSRLITKEFVEKEFPNEMSFARGMLTDLLDDPKEAQLAYELIMSVKEGK